MDTAVEASRTTTDRRRPVLGFAIVAALSLALVPAAPSHADADDGDLPATQAEFEHIGGGQFPGVQFAARVALTNADAEPLDAAAGTTARVTDGSGAVTPVELSPLGDGQFLLEAHVDTAGTAVIEILGDGEVLQSAELHVEDRLRALSAAPEDFTLTRPTPVAPGVRHQEVFTTLDGEPVAGHLLTADLHYSSVQLGLLHPGVVGASAPISEHVEAQEAVAGINGDFFDISGTDHHPDPTYAPVGPAIAGGVDFGGPVPLGQRFGPPLSTETDHVQTVFAAGPDGALITELSVAGTVSTPQGQIDVVGLDQYALAEDGVGAFTSRWGTSSRLRATCGSDTDREAACAEETIEVVVTDGTVTDLRAEPGQGPIGEDQVVLVGREAGAEALADLSPGDAVSVDVGLNAADDVDADIAVGGTPILSDDEPLENLEQGVFAPRTAVGVDAEGQTVYLLTIDGGAEHSLGYDIESMANLLGELGATDALNLDGGGSTTLVTHGLRDDDVTVQNEPSGNMERPVPNGIGLFSHRPWGSS